MTDPTKVQIIKDYLVQYRGQYTEEALREQLLQAGYTKEEIAEATVADVPQEPTASMSNVTAQKQPNPNPNTPQKNPAPYQNFQQPNPQPVNTANNIGSDIPKPFNWQLYAIIAVVIVLVGVGGFFGYKAFFGESNGENIAEESGSYIPDGYKRVGEEEFGYLSVPEEFVDFEQEGSSAEMMQFTTTSRDFTVTVMKYDDMEYSTVLSNMRYILSGSGSFTEEDSTVNDNDAKYIFQSYPEDNYFLHVWLIDEERAPKYIAIEYSGDKEKIKDNIIKSYNSEK